jgi:predicted glycosyl hydrolase (DUF1957 family)
VARRFNIMQWINFLHFYQPANADDYHIPEAVDCSYRRLIEVLENHPAIKFTINITGCLLVRGELDRAGLIPRLKKLIERGQIELTGSAAYHVLLPLVSAEEIREQIKENENILRQYFGSDFRPRGFFLPEMAYSAPVAKIIKEFGYDWIILDEISFNGKLGQIDDGSKIYIDENSGLKVIFRSRNFSNCYVPDKLSEFFQNHDLVITATDAELYGLRHKDPTGELEKALTLPGLRTELISDFIAAAPAGEKIKVTAASWESTEKELRDRQPYILWLNKRNKIQRRIWKLANLASALIKKYQQDNNYCWARWHLVRGLASCTFWWASGRDFSHNFGPRAWSPDEVERGLNELIRAIRSLHDVTARKDKIAAEKLYIKIKHAIWHKHWKYFWEREVNI